MIEELDLKILKNIVSDKVNALTFSYRFDQSLFEGESQKFGKLVLDYVKSFRSPPTRKTLLDRHKTNSLNIDIVNKFWDELDQIEVDGKEYTYDLNLLKKRYQESAVLEIKAKAENENPDNPEEFFKKLSIEIQRVTSLDLERTFIQKPVGDHVDTFQEGYVSKQLNPDQAPQIKTGFSMIDSVTGGLSPAELVMIGGQSNAGKSILLNALAKQIWLQKNTIDTKPSDFKRGYNVLYFSLEMPYDDCFTRFLASLANVPQRGLLQPHQYPLSSEEEERVQRTLNFIKEYQEAGYYFDIVDVPRNLTIEEVELRYNDALLRYQPEIVVIDYMGLMHSKHFANEPDWLRMGAYAASLHEFGRAYSVVMITAAQLTDLKRNSNNSKSEDSKRVGMHRWGRSSLIMHHVNFAIQIETRDNERVYPDMKVHVVKNRKGPVGNEGSLIKNFACTNLVDVPFDENEIPGDISESIPDLIKQIQEAKEKTEK